MHCVSTSALRWQYLLLLFWRLSLFLPFPIHHSELDYFRIFQIFPVSAWWWLHGGKACQRLLMSLYLHSPPPPQEFDLLMLAHRWHLSTFQNVLVESPYQFIWHPVVSAPVSKHSNPISPWMRLSLPRFWVVGWPVTSVLWWVQEISLICNLSNVFLVARLMLFSALCISWAEPGSPFLRSKPTESNAFSDMWARTTACLFFLERGPMWTGWWGPALDLKNTSAYVCICQKPQVVQPVSRAL